MKWNELTRLIKWQPVPQLPFPVSRLSDRILEVQNDAFLLVTPYADLTLRPREGGPFVSAVVWACDRSSVLRAVELKVEDDSRVIEIPPDEVLPAPGARIYSRILETLSELRVKGVMEKAAYRIARDGKFVHRIIESALATYFFRSQDHDGEEMPYAVIWKMEKKAAQPSATDNPDDAQRLREDH